MTALIWSLSELESLLDHPEPAVQEWALNKLFHLYPAQAGKRLHGMLRDNRQVIIEAALQHLGKEVQEELIPLLRDLYVQGEQAVSAQAMRVLGDWRCAEAVAWMRERVLQETTLAKEQVIAMIYALGSIPGDDAYDFLKQTEAAIKEKDSSHWDMFYASLLEHRRTEDLETLLQVVLDDAQKEERRRDALGLLLAQADPRLNPSDVFFNHQQAVRTHWLNRLRDLQNARHEPETDPVIELLKSLILDVTSETQTAAEAALQKLIENVKATSDFVFQIARRSMVLLPSAPSPSQWRFGLLCLAVSALLTTLEEEASPPPAEDSNWSEKLTYLLRNHPPQARDEEYWDAVLRQGERSQLVSRLASVLEKDPEGWGAYRAVEVLGRLKATEVAAAIAASLPKAHDALFLEAAKSAMLRLGVSVVPELLPLLDSPNTAARYAAREIVAEFPTAEGVRALLARLPGYYAENPESALALIHTAGAQDFLPFLEAEYRPGEWSLGKAIIHLCRLNGLQPDHLREIELEVKRGDAFIKENRRMLSGEIAHWPRVILLELACRECGKRYNYEISEMHLHPHKEEPRDRADMDMTPYRHGMVIVDDLRCKNCDALNQLQLTPRSFAQITAESVKILAFQRMKMEIPSDYPLKHVQLNEKDGQPQTLLDVEREHLDGSRLHSSRPAAHLALAKFYEYVKDYGKARRSYLRALDLDSRAVEAMAGLARLDHAEGKPNEALDWVQNCYDNLETGRFYLTEDRAAFKKAVRRKKREFARELGIKPAEKPVEIRFAMETPDYPKNRPCPCGSGKKYKLCCMKS